MAAKCSHCLVLISLVFFPFGVFFFFSFSAWGLRETKEGMNKGQGKRVIAAGLCHVVRKSGWNWRDQARPNSHSGRPWIVWLWQWVWTVTIAGDVSGCSSASSPCEVVLMGWCSQHFPHLPALTGSLEWQPLSFPNWHVHLDHGNWCGVAFFLLCLLQLALWFFLLLTLLLLWAWVFGGWKEWRERVSGRRMYGRIWGSVPSGQFPLCIFIKFVWHLDGSEHRDYSTIGMGKSGWMVAQRKRTWVCWLTVAEHEPVCGQVFKKARG